MLYLDFPGCFTVVVCVAPKFASLEKCFKTSRTALKSSLFSRSFKGAYTRAGVGGIC